MKHWTRNSQANKTPKSLKLQPRADAEDEVSSNTEQFQPLPHPGNPEASTLQRPKSRATQVPPAGSWSLVITHRPHMGDDFDVAAPQRCCRLCQREPRWVGRLAFCPLLAMMFFMLCLPTLTPPARLPAPSPPPVHNLAIVRSFPVMARKGISVFNEQSPK